MEEMPVGHIMGDMVMLRTGDVVVINGAQAGSQGFEQASNLPTIDELPEKINYGETFDIVVSRELPLVFGYPEVNIASEPFATHSFSQGQRLVKLVVLSSAMVRLGAVRFECLAPPDGSFAPPGYYMVFIVKDGVPSVAKWVQLI
ncbi:hypothetical protein CTI12_AA546550 [Artemisia annua]|uniref:Uncharacterized protein n=1 Tax=Artemisia annua TaxID=35608 RepID=A0A2U1KZG4_ARTAN|nr:hypothetical protein CTI12_AA546550 [Artemisia annua]